MNFAAIKSGLKRRGIEPDEHEETYRELNNRKEDNIKAHAQGIWGDARRIREYSLVLRQVLLHRAVKLFDGSYEALINDNGYSMALSIRAHFETTAAIGYLHNRLISLQQGSLDNETVDRDIMTQLMGTRDKEILKKDERGQEAKQILKMLEYADRTVSKHIMQGSTKEHAFLMGSYEHLCEFSHPNFHSNIMAYTLNKDNNECIFLHSEQIQKKFANLINYLLISNPIFVDLYDRIDKLLPHD